MIAYNPKDWFKLILSFHKSDTFRMLFPAIIGLGLFSAGIIALQYEYFHFPLKSSLAMHSLLGLVVSLMLVFRTNTAYDRWWEARRLWGGFVNHSRSFSMKMRAFVPVNETVKIQALLKNYFFACRDHLRRKMSTVDWVEVEGEPLERYTNKSHIPNAILTDLVGEVALLHRNGKINDTQMLMLNDELRSFAENMGACERINNTPIPYSYSMFIKKIIFFYVISLPFGLMTDFKYWTVLAVCFIFYAFASLELLAEEIEDPFGEDDNDLPTDQIARNIKKQVEEIFKHG
jgi:ion channel-forming bestrophin family protein